IESDIRGLNGDPSAHRHGIAGVDHQIHDRLFNVTRVGLDVTGIAPEIQLQFDILADETLQHLLGLTHDVVHRYHARLDDLSAAECQKLIRQRAGTLRGAMNLLGAVAQRVDGREIIENHTRVALDDGQHVVEVVRYAARKPPHGVHFLGLKQLFFELLSLADVVDESNGAQITLGVDVTQAHFDGKLAAVFAAGPPTHPPSPRAPP